MNPSVANVESWLRVWRTARHLRGSQLAYRLMRITRDRLRVRTRTSGHPRRQAVVARQPEATIPRVPDFSRGCAAGAPLVAALRQGELCLVNRTLPFQAAAPDWRLGAQREDRLWAITLHYHAWLYELARLIPVDAAGSTSVDKDHGAARESPPGPDAETLFHTLLHDWLDTCDLRQPGAEPLAWNSYAIATRLGWWARLWHTLGPHYWTRQPQLAETFLQSMHAQASHLAAHIEWDLRANHLLRDAVGLAWAGRFFRGGEAARWLNIASRIADRQADEQMLADGGHFERSPFYHLEVMDDWLTLARLLPARQVSEKMQATWRRSAEYARWLCHPDGRVAQFNDGAAAVAANHFLHDCETWRRIGAASPRGGRWLAQTGVVAWHGEPWTLFWDVGDVGPACQPGHAHADTLTVEASFQGHRLLVDPGSYGYDDDTRRTYDRSTAAHNTVLIDQQNSSEVWHIFRVGRRARPRQVSARIGTDQLWARAAHDGYDHLPGRPRHTRTVAVQNQGTLRIVDDVKGRGNHAVDGGLLIAPQWRAIAVPDGWQLSLDGITLRVAIQSTCELETSIECRPIHPDYGVEQDTQRLCWSYRGKLPIEVALAIEPTSPTNL